MRNFVIINGVNSNTINGLGINELPPITKPEMRNIREEIDGRDGDIITELGYSAYDKTITIGLFGTGYDINDIVAFFNGEGTIVFSNEPDKYYNFKILNQIDYESLQKFRTASITFHCQPFKYPLSETPLEIEYDYIEDEGENLTLNNTGNALMKLALKGNTSQSGTPTPTSPIPVSVVSGDNDVVVCGKNLLNLEDGTFTDGANLTIKIENQKVILNGTTSANYLWLNLTKKDYRYGTPNTTNKPNWFTGTLITAGQYIGSISENVGAFNVFQSDGTIKGVNYITSTANICSVGLYIDASGTTFNNKEITLQIEKGSATTYEPYQSQTYEVDLPVENLYEGSQDFSGVWNNSSSWVTDSETYNGLAVKKRAADWSGISKDITVSAGQTYTFSLYAKSDTARTARIFLTGGTATIPNPTYLEFTTTTDWKRYSFTFTPTGSGTIKPRLENTTAGGTNYTYICGYQLEKSSQMNTYQPYGTTPIELCKIGDYQDYFTKNSEGQWCKYNAIGKVVLDGSETWNDFFSTTGFYRYIPTVPSLNTTDTINCICDYYKGTTRNEVRGLSSSANNKCSIYGSELVLVNTSITSINNFKTWLGSNNTTVYYILQTPYLSLIEDNNLIEQLDNLENAMSYEGTTNIGQVNNDKAFIISAKALEDGTNEVVINNRGNVYSKPLLALEGSGNVDIYLDNTQILKANVEDKMNIDIAQLEAYNPDTMTLLNRQVIGNYNSMTLQPGNNTIRIDGSLDKATITNYTRWL